MAWYHRLRNVFRSARTSRDLEDELSFHIEERVDELMASGMAEDEARRLARHQFGSHVAHKEASLEVDTLAWLQWLAKDIRFALRTFGKKPLFAFASVLTLALGIGATTTIYSVVDTVLLRALPYPAADRLVLFDNRLHSYPQWRAWRELEAFEIIGAISNSEQVDLIGEGIPQRLPAAWVSPEFFRLIGAETIRGRAFDKSDYPGKDTVAVVSYGAWERVFGKDAQLIGRKIRINGKPAEVIGILAAGVRPPEITGPDPDIWFPLGEGGQDANHHGSFVVDIIGRLRPDRSLAVAQAQADAAQTALARESPADYRGRNGGIRMDPLVELQTATVRDTKQTLWILLGAVGFMHLIACTNVANLFLARGTSRAREIALRGALGASRSRIAGQVLTESLLIALLGGIAGIVLAYAGVEAFVQFNPGGIPRLDGLTVDLRILSFAFGLSVLTGLVFGGFPALQATRRNVSDALKDGSATITSRSGLRIRSVLVSMQTALAVVLLIGAGLLFRTLVSMMQVDPGFDPAKLVIVPVSLDAGYQDTDRRRFVDELMPRLQALPGVRAVSGARYLPFRYAGPGYAGMRLPIAADSTANAEPFESMVHPIATGLFATLHVPVIYGREFTAADLNGDAAVAIVNRRVARRLFGDDNVVGRRLKFEVRRPNVSTFTIIGVIDGMRHFGLAREIEDDIYVPYREFGAFSPFFEFVLRADSDLGTLAGPIREAIWSIDPNLPLSPALTMEQRISTSLASPRFLSLLFVVFATLALLLSCSGILSSLLYTVTERRRELGVRLVVGAKNSDLMRLVLRYGLVLSAIGVAAGTVAGIALSRLIRGMLWNVKPTDPATFIAVAFILVAGGVLASLIPAWNASRTDPLRTLRSE